MPQKKRFEQFTVRKLKNMQLNIKEDLEDEIMSVRIAVTQEKDLNYIKRSLG